jgi:hypothetical protein
LFGILGGVVDFASLESCADLTPEAAEGAASSAKAMESLLTRAAAIGKPDEGCAKILLAIARMAGKPWVEGELRIELSGDDTTTTIQILTDLGFNVVERVVPAVTIGAPLDEFVRAVELARHLVDPFVPIVGDGTMVLAAPPSDDDVEAIRIDTSSLASAPPPSSPHEIKTAPPPPAEEGVRQSLVLVSEASEATEAPPAAAANGDVVPPGPNVHTRPTRRMNALDPEIIRAATAKRDPRREDD